MWASRRLGRPSKPPRFGSILILSCEQVSSDNSCILVWELESLLIWECGVVIRQDAAGATQNKAKEVAGAAGDKMEQGKQGAADAAGATKDKANEASGVAGDKANQAGNVAGEKWEQTKQASSDAAQAASDKAAQAKDGAGSVLQQVGDAAANAFQTVKDTVTPKQ